MAEYRKDPTGWPAHSGDWAQEYVREHGLGLGRDLRTGAKAAGVPERYLGASLPQTRLAGHEEGMWRLFEEGTGLWLTGPAGTGKTTTAAAIAIAAVGRGDSVRFVNAVGMFTGISDSYGGGGSESDAIDRLVDVDLLVIDDLGKERHTAWTLEKLYVVLNARYDCMRPVVVTTQYDTETLRKALLSCGDAEMVAAVLSRLAGMTRRVVFDGRDFRKDGR